MVVLMFLMAVLLRHVRLFLYKAGKCVILFLHILHEDEFIHVCVSISVAEVFVVVAVEHIALRLLCPVLFMKRLHFLILVVDILVLYLHIDCLVVVLSLGVIIFIAYE